MKKYIYSALLLVASLTSCADMLAPESDLVMYPEDNQINTPNDTLYSVMGALHLMQQVVDRTNLLGEVRGDLVSLTPSASTDLQELASFDVSEKNIYNNPQDYYAIINNCNYFIEHADSTYKKQGVKVFERELAVMHSFRAWAYLQLAMQYGEIPFYTDFLGTQLDAERVMQEPKKSIKEVCNYLIDDLRQWEATHPLKYISWSNDCFIPVRMMLGELCLWAERYEEAAQFYHDFLTDVDNPKPIYGNAASWSWTPGDNLPTGRNYISYASFNSSAQDIVQISMESASLYGTISQLENLYCSTTDNNYYYEITYSQAAVEQSEKPSYYITFRDLDLKIDTIKLTEDSILSQITDRRCLGDLRLAALSRTNSYNNSSDKNMNDVVLTNYRHSSSSYVTLYTLPIIYLHFAEALNRCGLPTAAFTVLKYGLSEKTTNKRPEDAPDPIAAEERAKAGDLLTFNPLKFDASNTMGIHSRGCGAADANPEYEIPALVSANDTMLWVEDKIVEEMALEGIYLGQRYYDLLRVALRRDDSHYLADAIAARNGKDNLDGALQGKLMNRANWYLPLQK